MLNYNKMFSALTALMMGGSAMAQSVDLTMKWKPGLEYKVKQSIEMDMTMQNPDPNGGGGDISTEMNMAMGMKGLSEKVEEGMIVDMKFDTISMNMAMGGKQMMSYDSTKADPENPVGKAMEPLLKLNFKTLYGDDGKFVELKDFDEKALTPEMGLTKHSLESMMKQQSEMLPHRAVSVGDTWKSVLAVPMKGFEDGIKCNYNFKLASVSEMEGKQIARIDFTADMEKMKAKQMGMEMVMNAKNIEGYFLFDVKKGQFTKSESFFDMIAEVKNMEMMMKMVVKVDFDSLAVKK